MCKQFFYKNAQEIQLICSKLNINQFKISFRNNIASIYLDFGVSTKDTHISLIKFKEQIDQLACEVFAPITAYYFPIEYAGEINICNPISFNIFLEQSLINMIEQGNFEEMKKLLEAINVIDINIVLQAGIKQLYNLYNNFNLDNEDLELFSLKEMENIRKCIKILIETPKEKISLNNIISTQSYIFVYDKPSENTRKAETIISEIFGLNLQK